MSENKCFCHLNGFEVKDAKARKDIETLNNTANSISEDVTVLETRMNTFTALPEGSTTADAEVIDARLGADGKTYSNLGEAIRTQFNSTNGDLSKLKEEFISEVYEINQHQLFDPFKIKCDGYYQSNGNFVARSDYWHLTIDVKEGQQYSFTGIDETSATGVKTNNIASICPIKSDGSFYCESATEIQWKGHYTVPVGSDITKLIVSHAVGVLVNGLYSITDYVPSTPNPTRERYISKIEPDKNRIISCIGDSLTESYGGGGVTYPNVLAQNNNKLKVYTMGHSSKDTEYIANATGGLSVYVKPCTIPATTTPVEITLENTTKTVITFDRLTTAINPITIDGVEGDLSYSSNKMFFTRSKAGEEKVITRPTKIITNFEKKHRKDICIIWAGTNNVTNGTSQITSENCTVINIIKDIIDTLETKKYLVIAPISKAYHSNIADMQVMFKRAFGSHFVNLRQYMLDYGLADAGITATEQDLTDIANGEIPSSLRFDTVHLNSSGYTVIGNFLYKELKIRGYVD